MDSRTRDRVERWESRPFAGGYDGLADLAADEFSGAVEADGTWLFLLNGRVVGVVDGAIEDAENASGTVYDAPHPALPLLCSMEERGGETRAKYYTNDTPLREVDGTLRDGSFTGYVELSENVLSGDYYAVYYGGRRMAAAYIGNAERLLTGEEAFERAADEVGIYEVIDVDVDVTDVPSTDPAGESDAASTGPADGAGAASTGPTGTGGSDVRSTGPGETDESDVPSPASDAESDDRTGITRTGADAGVDADDVPGGTGITDAESGDALDADPTGVPDADPTDASDRADGPAPGATGTDSQRADERDDAGSGAGDRGSAEPDADASAGESPDADPDSGGTSPTPEEVAAAADELDVEGAPWTTDAEGADGTAPEDATDGPVADAAEDAGDGPVADADAEAGDAGDDLDERFKQEEQWRETRSIPSLDPDRSDPESGSNGRTRGGRAESAGTDDRRSTDATARDRQGSSATSASGETTSRTGGPSRADLRERVEALEERRDELETRREELAAERDRLESENEELSATVERLRERVEELEAELARRGTGGESAAGTGLDPRRALAETNLFVRYDSKSEPTLRSAHDGDADRTEVSTNLRLEHHTTFDADDATVDGAPYDEFLPATIEYRFVDWLVDTLLYEIRDTGHDDGLGELYDAIPRVDRAEFDASISLADDDTEDVPDEVGFDVVAFDKRGTPLIVAALHDSREPVPGERLESVEEKASAVGANYPDLAAALVVTSSFFEPDALEVTERATGGGFLSRSAKLSYVNVARKRGYHLCLVESRGGDFHVNVPEL